MNEILLYSGIYSFTAEEFINRVKDVPAGEDLVVRLNSPGGSVFAGWGVIAAITEHEGRSVVKVDGNASSMAFFMLPFFDYVEALDVAGFMVHRADAYIETPDDQKMLDNANKMLKAKLAARIDKNKFKEITGFTFDEIFTGETRRNVWLTAKEARDIGIVDKVVRLQPREIEAINKNLVAFANFDAGAEAGKETQGSAKQTGDDENRDKPKVKQKTFEKMTKEQLRAEHPELYASIFTEGVNEERDRVGGLLAFVDIDAGAVVDAIKKGDKLSNTFMAEMTKKAISAQTRATIEKDSPDAIDPKAGDDADKKDEKKAEPKAEDDKELEAAKADIFKAAGLKIEED